MTNQDLLFMNQNATYSRPVDTAALGAAWANIRVWRATINQPGERGYAEYLGFFNLDSRPATIRATWKQLGLDGNKHAAQSAWDESVTKASKEVGLTLPAHGSMVYQVR
jgi:alpha-galactosidase